MDRSPIGETGAAVAAALAPYAWREFTDHMLARRAVGAMDRYAVVSFVADLPGTDVGDADPLEPADAEDARVAALLRALDGQQWRERPLARLCLDLCSVVAAWLAARDAPGHDLRRLDGV